MISITKIANMAQKIPRGTIIGKVTGGKPLTEAAHFWKCEACAAPIMGDAGSRQRYIYRDAKVAV
jgi:hypothetical protein